MYTLCQYYFLKKECIFLSTSKPKIVIYSEDKTIKKLDEIAKANKRSRGNMAEIIINDYIDNYEKEHGEIIAAENKIVEIRKSLDPFA